MSLLRPMMAQKTPRVSLPSLPLPHSPDMAKHLLSDLEKPREDSKGMVTNTELDDKV